MSLTVYDPKTKQFTEHADKSHPMQIPILTPESVRAEIGRDVGVTVRSDGLVIIHGTLSSTEKTKLSTKF